MGSGGDRSEGDGREGVQNVMEGIERKSYSAAVIEVCGGFDS